MDGIVVVLQIASGYRPQMTVLLLWVAVVRCINDKNVDVVQKDGQRKTRLNYADRRFYILRQRDLQFVKPPSNDTDNIHLSGGQGPCSPGEGDGDKP